MHRSIMVAITGPPQFEGITFTKLVIRGFTSIGATGQPHTRGQTTAVII
jgi:hypothetical protein